MKKFLSVLVFVVVLFSVSITVLAVDAENPDLLTDNVTVVSGETAYYTTSGEVDCSIKVEDGATLVLVDAQIKCTTDNPIQFLGSGTLLLIGESTVISNCNNYAAINVVEDGQLTVEDYASDEATGSLRVVGGSGAAGIGGNFFEDVGEIVINGGIINATGGTDSAAIGGGKTYVSSDYIFTNPSIIINDGIITANGNGGGAGIGSGRGNVYTLTIEINGGEITSTGGSSGAGIGGGYLAGGSAHTTININGGNIDAVGKSDGAGIGSSFTSNYTYDLIINITGGDINARCISTSSGFGGNGLAAGIGSGPSYSSSGWATSNAGDQIINISGGKIYALAGLNGFNEGGAGIGGGHLSAIDSITISGGLVYARGYRYTSNDIGGGYRAQSLGTREISGDSVVFVFDENNFMYYMNSIQTPNHTRYSRSSFEDVLAQNNTYGIDAYFFSCRYVYVPNTVSDPIPTNNVTGTVYDYYGDALDGITVTLDTHSANSGSDGNFSINNIDMTDYTLNIENGAVLLNRYEYQYASSSSNNIIIDDVNNIITAKVFDNYDVHLFIQLSQDGTVAHVVSEIEYQIVYHDNFHVTNANPTSYVGSDGAISITDLTQTGYSFDGWYDNAAYSGKAITEIAEDSTGRIDLYAKWTPNTYELIFHINDGMSADVNTQNILYGQTAQLNENVFEYEGYTFSHWNTEADDSGDSYEKSAVYTMNEQGEDLYAIWSVNTDTGYSVEYCLQNIEDDDYTVYETENKYGTTDTLASIVNDDIKSFVGFNYVSGHENEALSGNINGDESLVLRLYYDRVVNDIIFNANSTDPSVSGVPANIENVRYGENITIPNDPLRDGHSLVSWTDGIADYTAGNSFIMPANTVTLSANWQVNTFEIIFLGNGGIGEMADQEFTYGVSRNLRTNAFERERHAFAGWAASAEGEVEYTDGQEGGFLIADGSEELMLYAVWNEIPVGTIAFDISRSTMNVGDYKTLANTCPYTISPSDATNRNVTWESADTSVVSINSISGTITANAAGISVITISTEDGGYTDTMEVQVITPDEETPDEETPDEETPDEETPDEETPDEETPDVHRASVTGTVVDSDGTPLSGYTVTLNSDPVSTTTDREGRFHFSDVAYTSHTLTIADDVNVVGRYSLEFSSGSDASYRFVGDTVDITYSDNTISVDLKIEISGDSRNSTDPEIASEQEVSENPKGGNNSNRLWWLLVLVLPLGILVFWVRKKKKA
ncbi:MAG: InlB B-repeat-containing protein [Clostridiales bacterium]|nr:InlB B-repeat-containing protein [Clostridiales bacterium]